MLLLVYVFLLAAGTCLHGRPITTVPERVLTALPEELQRLTVDDPLVGELAIDALKFGIAVEARNGSFPDILITVDVLNAGASASVYCLPFRESSELDADSTPWTSQNAQGTNHVFISTNSPYYRDAIVRSDNTMAEFLCSLNPLTVENPEYSISMDVSYSKRKLRAVEREAVEDIYKSCCDGPGACNGWKELYHSVELEEETAIREVTNFDLCHAASNVCDEDGYLLKLTMDRFGLQCHFPVEEIVRFERLQKLSMAGNELTGDFEEIAAALQELEALDEITLRSNLLSGSLVGEEGASNPLCKLANSTLQHLHLQSNGIEGPIPECLLATGSQLRDLYLSQNPIGGEIPDTIARHSHLESIVISSAGLTGPFPLSFLNTDHLVLLDLSYNNLEGVLPPAFGPSPMLRYLRLRHNRFTGKIPRGIAASETLETVHLDHNAFDSLPDQWLGHGPKTPLVNLDISFNEIDEDFPHVLAGMDHLSTLFLNDNKFKGPLPTMDEMFPNAWVLNFSNNAFTGNLPQEWTMLGMFAGTAQKLNYTPPLLDLSHNELSGRVPSFFFTPDNFPKEVSTSKAVNLEGNNFSCPEFGSSTHLKGFEHCETASEDTPVYGETVFDISHHGDGNSNPSEADTVEENDSQVSVSSSDQGQRAVINHSPRDDGDSGPDTILIVITIVSAVVTVSVALGILMRFRMLCLAKAVRQRPEDDAEIRTVKPEPVQSSKDLENARLRTGVEQSDAAPL